MSQTLAPLRIYDVLWAADHAPGYTCWGREPIFEYIARTWQREDAHQVAVVGRSGVGKTMLIQGLAQAILKKKFAGLRPLPFLQLDTQHLVRRLNSSANATALVAWIDEAVAALPACMLAIDDTGQLIGALPDPASIHLVLSSLAGLHRVRGMLFFSDEEWRQIQDPHGALLKTLEVVYLDELSEENCRNVLADRARFVAGRYNVRLHADVPAAILEYSQQLSGTSQPDRALKFFDEICAAAVLHRRPAVTRAQVQKIFAQRVGQPEISALSLRAGLAAAIIGQTQVVDKVAAIIERGWLGLKNPERPLGSFLFLGPSGVGKTELARALAKQVYGTPAAFVRLDMSEYKEAHSVQRLIGSPPGYVGHEAGGQLTSAVQRRPFCLILLDEIEKADPAIFDVFLQVLEDGRLTDGQGTCVDFRKTIILATSNLGVERIIEGWLRNEDVTEEKWRQQNLMPALTERWRLEFLNRFEDISVFAPLSEESLMSISRLELAKITQRLKHHRIAINISERVLRKKVQVLSDPRFGARPLKRWLEGAVESAVARYV